MGTPFIHLGNAGDPTSSSPLEFTQPSWPLINHGGNEGGSLVNMALADVNGDGVPDLLALVDDEYSGLRVDLHYYLLERDGGLLASGLPDADGGGLGNHGINMAVGDFTGDGVPDVALSGSGQPQPVLVADPSR